MLDSSSTFTHKFVDFSIALLFGCYCPCLLFHVLKTFFLQILQKSRKVIAMILIFFVPTQQVPKELVAYIHLDQNVFEDAFRRDNYFGQTVNRPQLLHASII